MEYQPKKLTRQQQKALYLFFRHLSDALNNSGFTVQELITMDIDFTPEIVKDTLWLPFMKSMYGIESTTQLDKQEQITKIHETLMRELGEKKGIEYIPFPSNEIQNSKLEYADIQGGDREYPENTSGEPTI